RRDDDCRRLDDRVGHFYNLRGIIAVERRAGLAAASVGYCWFTDHYWCAVLLGIGHNDAARGWRLRFSTRSIRSPDWIFVRLDAVSCDSDRDDCCGSDRVCKISWRLCHSSLAGQLSGGANLVWSLRNELVTGTIGRDRLDRLVDVEQ